MVLKTGPDRLVRLVQLGTDLQSGPIMGKNRKSLKNGENLETGRFNRESAWSNRLMVSWVENLNYTIFFFKLFPNLKLHCFGQRNLKTKMS